MSFELLDGAHWHSFCILLYLIWLSKDKVAGESALKEAFVTQIFVVKGGDRMGSLKSRGISKMSRAHLTQCARLIDGTRDTLAVRLRADLLTLEKHISQRKQQNSGCN